MMTLRAIIRSLDDLADPLYLATHGRWVEVWGMAHLSDGKAMFDRLKHQIEAFQWEVRNLRPLEAAAEVDQLLLDMETSLEAIRSGSGDAEMVDKLYASTRRFAERTFLGTQNAAFILADSSLRVVRHARSSLPLDLDTPLNPVEMALIKVRAARARRVELFHDVGPDPVLVSSAENVGILLERARPQPHNAWGTRGVVIVGDVRFEDAAFMRSALERLKLLEWKVAGEDKVIEAGLMDAHLVSLWSLMPKLFNHDVLSNDGVVDAAAFDRCEELADELCRLASQCTIQMQQVLPFRELVLDIVRDIVRLSRSPQVDPVRIRLLAATAAKNIEAVRTCTLVLNPFIGLNPKIVSTLEDAAALLAFVKLKWQYGGGKCGVVVVGDVRPCEAANIRQELLKLAAHGWNVFGMKNLDQARVIDFLLICLGFTMTRVLSRRVLSDVAVVDTEPFERCEHLANGLNGFNLKSNLLMEQPVLSIPSLVRETAHLSRSPQVDAFKLRERAVRLDKMIKTARKNPVEFDA